MTARETLEVKRLGYDYAGTAASVPGKGFVAGFSVFAHGVCWGAEDHCEIPDAASPFDMRPEHRLTPQNVTLDITDAVLALGEVDELEVTLLAQGTSDDDLLRFSALTLVTYE